MQSSAGQRVLSTLASKLHPQLPLTPRESQQLLTLLTASFRTHLDREYPVNVPEKHRHDYESPHATSSSVLASQHIDAVLSNPLFAVKPSHRRSKSAASEVLKDPMGWFLNQIATGDATLSKASMCLDLLDRRTTEQPLQLYNGKAHGAIIGNWLQSSGLDASSDFLEMCIAKPHTKRPSDPFLLRLVSLLIAHGRKPSVWKWYTRSWHSSLDPSKLLVFRKQLLRHMVHVEASKDIRQGIILFKRAYDLIGRQSDKPYEQLRPAGQYLVQSIMSRPTNTIGRDLYNSFKHSTRLWINSKWSQAVDSMLWLHHPTMASAAPGLRFIKDPAGAASYAKAISSQRRFIVQLSLGIARQLLEEESYRDAQTVMVFAKQHFPDLVLQQPVVNRLSKVEREQRREERNLELLDNLALT